MFYRYSSIWSDICNSATLEYIILVVYKWKLFTYVWITIWTEKNTTWQGNNVNVWLLISCNKITFSASKELKFNTVIPCILKNDIFMVFVRRQHCSYYYIWSLNLYIHQRTVQVWRINVRNKSTGSCIDWLIDWYI